MTALRLGAPETVVGFIILPRTMCRDSSAQSVPEWAWRASKRVGIAARWASKSRAVITRRPDAGYLAAVGPSGWLQRRLRSP
jgi:hypothetical protein